MSLGPSELLPLRLCGIVRGQCVSLAETRRRTLPDHRRLLHILLENQRDRGKHTGVVIWHDLQ
jgi:hypothetical protein